MYWHIYAQRLEEEGKPVPEDRLTGWADPSFFEKDGAHQFSIKPGVSASDALDAFLKGPTVADCGCALYAMYYLTLRDFLGKEKFDSFFGSPTSKGSKGALRIDSILLTPGKFNPLQYFLSFSTATYFPELYKHLPGEMVYIQGVSHFGVSGGYNVLCTGEYTTSGEPLYVGFGIHGPRTERQIRQILLDDYNAPRTPKDEDFIAKAKNKSLYDLKACGFSETCTIEETKGLVHCSGIFFQVVDEKLESLFDDK